MPCTGGPYGDNNQNNHPDLSGVVAKLTEENQYLTDDNQFLTGCLCALIRELEKKNISGEIILAASTNGKVDISKFWKQHVSEDQARILQALSKFSEHEISIIKSIVNSPTNTSLDSVK